MTDKRINKQKQIPTEDPQSSRMGDSGERTCLEKVLILILALCLVTIVVLTVLFIQSSRPTTLDICLTKECAEIATRITTSIDYRLDPCDDFYEFACGMWMKKHVVPDDRPNLYTHGVVREEVIVTVKYLLEGSRENDIAAIRKARDHYHSCMNETHIEFLNISVMIDLLEELGGMPMLENSPGGRWNESSFNFMEEILNTQNFISAPLLYIYVGIDDKKSDRRIIFVDEPPLGMGSNKDISGPLLDALREAFVYYSLNMMMFFGADKQVAKQDLIEVYDLHTLINNISMTHIQKRDRDFRYNKMTIADLEKNFSSSITQPNITDNVQFNWLQLIQSVLNLAGENITLDYTEKVILTSPKYFRNLFSILHQQKPRTIKNYMLWVSISQLFNKLPGRFMDEVTLYQNYLTGTNKKQSRWKKCSGETMANFAMAVGRLFVKEKFDEEAKHKALEMIHDIREAFYERLEDLDWMDSSTRILAKEKARHIIEKIGYPDYILDDDELNKIYESVDINRDEYFTNTLNFIRHWRRTTLQHLRKPYQKSNNRLDVPPANVNAYYTPNLNLISFPAGILQPPYYSKYQPRSMNYGSIGWLIGHEIIHGFDDIGRQYDKEGNMRQWWSNEAIAQFQNKTTCFIDQYNNYTIRTGGLNIDGLLTLGENIADNGGLILSYKAYQNWVRDHPHQEPGLPGVNFTHNQLFFINFAQGWCGVATEQYDIKQIYTDTHSPVRYRIIGSLQNFEEFSHVFSCPVGSYMNPQRKCHVW